MESDDDYESFSLHNNEPSPSPKHRRLKRLKKSTAVAVQSTAVESVTEEALKSSDIGTIDGNSNGNGNGNGEEWSPRVDGNDDLKVKELRSCYDDTHTDADCNETKEDLVIEEDFNDDVMEKELSSGGDAAVRTDRKETKRALDFDDYDDDVHVNDNENGVDELAGNEGENIDMDVRADVENEDVMNDKTGKKKKKRLKSSDDEPKAKTKYSSKRREEKERRAHLDQLHAETQRILRETRGVSFKPVPLVQKPISSILEKIRQRKLEVSKKFNRSSNDDSEKEDVKYVANDQSESVEKEVDDLSESVKEDKVSNAMNVDHVSDESGTDGPDVCGEQKSDVDACSQKDLDVDPTPAIRAPVDDTQELFGDTQTSDGKESENEESCEHDSSSQEEEMGPSLLTMKLKFDSVPDDTCDEEENDKENVDPHVQEHSSPKGDHAKAFLDDEAEEEDDSDNDRMVFGDDEEDEEEDEDDIEELNKMIATGYKERPIDLETRNELHQKWLEEKDAAGTDDLLRRLNVSSKLKEASLLDDDDEGEEDAEMNDNASDDNDNGDEDDVHEDEDVERPRRMNFKKAKEMVAQMFNDKDDDYYSSDDEETEKTLVKERLLNKDTEKGKLVSPIEDEDSREVFGLIKKLNTVPEGRKKAKITSYFDTTLIGSNSNSSSKSSFLSRMSNNSVSLPSKQGGPSWTRSFIFGRDDSNSRSSILNSEDTSDAIAASNEMQTKKVTTKYKSSQSQGRSSTQTTSLVSESSSTSFFEILKQSSLQPNIHNQDHKVEISQSVFASFKIPKKPIKIQGRI